MTITAHSVVVAPRGLRGLVHAIVEEGAVRQPGERVVQGLVLVDHRLAGVAVDGDQRERERGSIPTENSPMITISGARPSAKPAVEERSRKSWAKKRTTG